ncbi:hypothetical protein [Streptomyces sp. TS71-3]|uniref:hypothetical protein n=1 Tax=Streptomyces sp. TS71-3 TaxID=2733862 RepID=UPI001B0E3AFA|nr:hypothetical protein [Streptomyces sp. TS71-3]GHJ35657.1 hypothetical protein Sm713_12660 [Streptomyces sp. TS71-3]
MTDTLRRTTVTAATGLGLCLALLPAGPAQARAATSVPCNDVTALTAAITDANTSGSGSIVLAPRCVYSLTAADNPADGLPEITGNVRITGDGTTIERSSGQLFRIFHVRAGGSLSLKSVTVRFGELGVTDPAGGGILNVGGTVTLTDSSVRNNTASAGGGIWNQLGTLVLKNTTVSNNRADWGGGVGTSGTMTMQGGALRHNASAFWGGGLVNGGDTRLTKVSVADNDSGDLGGGIVTLAINGEETGPLRLNSSKVTGNIARNDGGGFMMGADETTTIERSTVKGNTSNGGPATGGGIEDSGVSLGLFVGASESAPRGEKTATRLTPFRVDLIRSSVVKNFPTNCAPPGSVPNCVG